MCLTHVNAFQFARVDVNKRVMCSLHQLQFFLA